MAHVDPRGDAVDMNETADTIDNQATDTQSGGSGFAPPAPPPPPTPSYRWWDVRVSRDRDNGKIAGVVAGLSRAYGFDLKTTRIAVVIGAILLPVVLPAYLIAWVLLPRHVDEAVALRSVLSERRRLPLIVAAALVLIAAGFGWFGSWFYVGGSSLGVALIAVGLLFWIAPRMRTEHRSPERRPNTWPLPIASASEVAPSSSHAEPSLRRVRRRYPIVAITTVLTAAYVLFTVAGNALGLWNSLVLWVVVVAIVIMITGIAIGAIVNRRWIGVPGGLILASVLGFLLISQPNLNGGVGERSIAPNTVAAAAQREVLGTGQLTIDLTQLESTASATAKVTVHAEVGFGRLHVIVPADAVIELATDVGAGHVVIDGREITSGFRQDDNRTDWGAGDRPTDGQTFVLDLKMGAGEIAIDREAERETTR